MDNTAIFNIRQINPQEIKQSSNQTDALVRSINDQLLSMQRNFNLIVNNQDNTISNALLYGGS